MSTCAQEQDDALEVIAWIARQPWCSGKVGMMGKSWGAYNSLQVAARRPPALKAIIAVMGTDDRYAECIHYSGGCLLNDNFWWGCIMQMFNARPPDPADRRRALARDVAGAAARRRDSGREIWLEHPALDDYWKHGSVCFDYGAIECPIWFWGGWADLYRDTPLRLAAHLQVPHKVTVGPWAHLYPHEAIPAPAVGFLQEALRWWDHWLKGVDRDVMQEPALNFYMMEACVRCPSLVASLAGTLGRRGALAQSATSRSQTLALNPDASLRMSRRRSGGVVAALAANDRARCRRLGELRQSRRFPGDQRSTRSARWSSTASRWRSDWRSWATRG